MPRALAARLALALIAAAALLPPASADAQPRGARRPGVQDPATDHQGFYIGFGLGPGRLVIDCEECGVPDRGGAWSGGTSGGFMFGMGGAISPTVLLGGEVTTWVTSASRPRNSAVANVSFVTQVYPRPRSGLFVRGGLGVGVAILEDESLGILGSDAITSTGFSAKAGLGYDFRFGGSFGLTPFVDYVHVFSQGDELRVPGGQRYVGPPNPGSLQAGLSFNWY
jgi:hypothetical protein